MQPCTSRRSASERRHTCLRRARSSQMSSEEPPPMSNTSAKSQPKSISEAQPETASLASVSRLTILMSRPVSARARSRNSGPLAARRQASVAIRPERTTRCRWILAAHTLQRLDGALDGRLRQPAARGHALAEADDAREGVDDLEAAPRGPRDQQPAVVGAEIEGGIGRLGRHRAKPQASKGASPAAWHRAGDDPPARLPRTPSGAPLRFALPTLASRGAQLGCAVLVLRHPPPSVSGARFQPRCAVGRHSGWGLSGTLSGRRPG